MLDELKSYPDYAESNVPWIDRLPRHWEVKRGKSLFSESHLPVQENDEIVTCFRDGQVTLRRNRRTTGFMIALKEVGYQGVRRGQLVIHAMDAFAGAVGISDSDGKCSPEYIVCNPRRPEWVPGYYARALRLAAHSNFIQVSCPAVRERAPRLRYPDFGDMLFPVPPPDEQAAIVRFLDHAEGRIRRYIRGKQKLIKLLDEQKQAVIYGALSRGLEPTVRLKSSGMDWLGDVPEHWELRALWTLARPRAERNPGNLGLLSVFLDRGVIPYSEGGGQVHPPSLDLSNYQVVHPGDLVLNNQQAWRGSVGVSKHHGIISPAYIVLAVSDEIDPCYGNYLMRSRIMVRQFVVASRGVGDIQRQVYWPYLRKVIVPLPPLPEQRMLAAQLDNDTRSLVGAASAAYREIELLREYRTRLVADVMTGKFDVRAAVTNMPDPNVEVLGRTDDFAEDEPEDTGDGCEPADEDV